jgi:hypothetical protein
MSPESNAPPVPSSNEARQKKVMIQIACQMVEQENKIAELKGKPEEAYMKQPPAAEVPAASASVSMPASTPSGKSSIVKTSPLSPWDILEQRWRDNLKKRGYTRNNGTTAAAEASGEEEEKDAPPCRNPTAMTKIRKPCHIARLSISLLRVRWHARRRGLQRELP